MMNFPAYIQVLILAILSFNTAHADHRKQPLAVSCTQDKFALCAYANCTINGDLKTASCPCYVLSGPSLARIDLIPNPGVKQATKNQCTRDVACSSSDAPLCDAIADGTMWPGADAVSTFSRDLEVKNGVVLDWDGERGAPNWSCPAKEGRLVPNCMLAPCHLLEAPATNPFFHGNAMMECTCPLIRADVDYVSHGGLQSPCDSSPMPKEGGYVQNTAGQVLNRHVSDSSAVALAWEAVAAEFKSDFGADDGRSKMSNDQEIAPGRLGTLGHVDGPGASMMDTAGSTRNEMAYLICALILPVFALSLF
ncbi:hypothetical protein ACHAWF_004553 [Thalassiosira exigua]